MNAVRVFKLLEETWQNTIPEKRISQLKLIRQEIPEEHLELFDGMLDAKISGVQDSPDAVVVLCIHGIQTDGAWHQHVKTEIGKLKNTNVTPLGYNFVSPLQLASPVRSTPINKIMQDFRDARAMEPMAKLMVIAHSFGSYILSQILPKCPDIRLERIILCGSIVPTNYNWGHYTRGMQPNSIINDVGTRDFYPVMATFTSFGYGSSGRKGFQSPHIRDRYFDYGHSDFFENKNNHIETYWKPFIEKGEIIESDWDVNKPKTSIGVMALTHPWIGRPLFYGALIGLTLLIIAGVRWYF
ncbi:hypothetical protein [Pseudomonas sp. S3_E10]